MEVLGRQAGVQGIDFADGARAGLAGLLNYVPRHYQERGDGIRRWDPVLAEFAIVEFRTKPGWAEQRRHALLGGVARSGADRRLHKAVPAVYVRVRVTVVPGDEDDKAVRRTEGFGPTVGGDAGASEERWRERAHTDVHVA